MSSNIYESLVGALRAHWMAHDNHNPQKMVLNQEQYRQLMDYRQTGRTALGDVPPPEQDSFLGVPVEVDDASPGVVIEVDGNARPLVQATAPAAT